MNEFGFHSKSIEASPLGVEYSTAAMPLRSLRSGTLISLAGLNCALVLTSSTCGASTRERQPGAEIRLPEATLWAGIALRVDHAIQDLAANNRGPMPVLKISIYVFNSAHVARHDLIRAERSAAAVFAVAGVQISWRDGLIARKPSERPIPECWDPAHLDVRIWSSTLARKIRFHPDALGYHVLEDRSQAVVLSDKIQTLASKWGADGADLLALAMAHEIGHLLLGGASHSDSGIMKERFNLADLMAFERGHLFFTSMDGILLRNQALRRMLGLAEGQCPADHPRDFTPAPEEEGEARQGDTLKTGDLASE